MVGKDARTIRRTEPLDFTIYLDHLFKKEAEYKIYSEDISSAVSNIQR